MRWVEANGVALRYELRGEGRAIVLIHEMGGTLETWDLVVPALVRGHRVLRYDLRGSGLSEKVRGALHIDTLADDLAALLDRLAIAERVVVAGCAVGAAVAIHFAARHADRTAGLIAMAPATFLPPDRRQNALRHAEILEREGLRAASRSALLADVSIDDPAEILRCRRLGNDPIGVAALWRMLADLSIDDDLTQIRCPALVLAGKWDESRPPDLVEKHVAQRISGASFRTLDTGHVMPVETPDLVIGEMIEFLASLR